MIINKRGCIFNFLSNRNIYYVIELPFVFGDILIICYLFKQKDSILIIIIITSCFLLIVIVSS